MKRQRIWMQIDGGFYLLLAFMLLLFPLCWVLAMILAAAFHELCHFGAIVGLGGRVYGLRLKANGAKMEIERLPAAKELLAALAGPAGSALLVLTAGRLPRLAVCGFVHCLFNLLPLFPMDGGRALFAAVRLLPWAGGERVFFAFQRIVRCCLVGLCLWLGLKCLRL